MAEALQITRIQADKGRPEKDSLHLASFQGKGLLRGVTLCALAEGTETDSGELCHWALTSLERSMNESKGSLTSVLPSAIQRCHTELTSAIASEGVETAIGLGLTCAALRGKEVYLAHVGPGLVYIRSGKATRRIWRGSGDKTETLGLTPGHLRVALHRHEVGPDDGILVSMSSLERLTTLEGVRTILQARPQEAAQKLYLLTREEPAYCAFLITS